MSDGPERDPELSDDDFDWFLVIEPHPDMVLPDDGPVPLGPFLDAEPRLREIVATVPTAERLFGLSTRLEWDALLGRVSGACGAAPVADLHRVLRVAIRHEPAARQLARDITPNDQVLYYGVVTEDRGAKSPPPRTRPLQTRSDLLGNNDPYIGFQSYLLGGKFNPKKKPPGAPGLRADKVWRLPGGLGQGAHVTLVEGGWTVGPPASTGAHPLVQHQDLSARVPLIHGHVGGTADISHGMATLGVLAAEPENGVGLRGLVPRATLQVVSKFNNNQVSNSHAALVHAVKHTPRGGIVVLAMENKRGHIPLERDKHIAAALRLARSLCVTVVTAFGNGGREQNTAFGWTTQPASPLLAGNDNGAIRVAAVVPKTGKKLAKSNYGHGVSAHSWGDKVTSFSSTQYTLGYSHTSAATALVAGAAALVQALWLKKTPTPLTPLSPRVLRALLYDTGSPSATGTDQIGRQPNVYNAYKAF